MFLCLALSLVGAARADEKLFTYNYEAEVLPKGGLEFEQWIANFNGQAKGVFSRWELRSELEYGVLDNLSGSLCLNFNSEYSSVNDPVQGNTVTNNNFTFDGISTEWKYRMLNPNTSPLGLLLYLEPRYSGTQLEIEPKLILQSNLGESWVLALNLVAETEYGYDAAQQTMTGKEEVDLGLGWKLAPPIAVGLEGRNLRILPNWGNEVSSAWHLGPSVHVETDQWWATLTVFPQIQGQPATIPGDNRTLGDDDHARVETRLIAGLNF